MNTPAHVILSAAVFSRPDAPRTNTAAILGALAPDLSLYLMVSASIFLLGVPPQTVFRVYYYSPEWQMVFAIDNSFVLWGTALGLALFARQRVIAVFCGSALLHLAFDFPLHNHDARKHFWPISDWKFHSPVSYWDRSKYGNIVEPIEIAVCCVLLFVLFRRFHGVWARAAILFAGAALLAPLVIWGILL